MHLLKRKNDVLEGSEVRKEVEGLEHDADPPPDGVLVDADRRDLVALDPDATGVDRPEGPMNTIA